MGCKFSIQVDQPRNKTPRMFHRKRSSSVQTMEQVHKKEEQSEKTTDKGNKGYKDAQTNIESSPDQVDVKTISSVRQEKTRGLWRPW